ncbi:MAG: phosphoesterase [Thermoplasmata archaeon]|nr:MAG: phosphoesterase [Thermoplasmata archaeon]
MMIQPVVDEPVLLVDDGRILVVADLHIGIENDFKEHGLCVPSQTMDMTIRLLSLFRKYRPREIVLLGDVKHNIPSLTSQERVDVKRFFETIQRYGVVHVLPGNHDGGIKKIVSMSSTSKVMVHPSDGFVIGGVGFVHGHRWPSSEVMGCEYVVVAHTHPTVMLRDRMGYMAFEPCWLKGRFFLNQLRRRYPDAADPYVVVMPAFNPLCGGIAVNKEQLLGPIVRIMDVENAEVYLLDGSCLGRVRDIR